MFGFRKTPEENPTGQSRNITVPDLRASHAVSLRPGVGIGWIRLLAFIGLDTLLISLAWIIAQSLGRPVGGVDFLWQEADKPGFLMPILLIVVGFIASGGLYGEREQRRRFLSLIKCITFAQIVLLAIAYLYQPGLIFVSRSTFLLAWLFSLLFVSLGRAIAELTITTLRRKGAIPRRIVLIGTPRDTLIATISIKLASHNEFRIVDRIDLSLPHNRDRWPEILNRICKQNVGEIFVCSWQSISNPMDFYWSLKTVGMNLRIVPVGWEIPNHAPRIEMIAGMPTLEFHPPALVGSDFWVKRGFDLCVAASFLIFASPILILIAILIKYDSPGPIFYKQTRIGLRGRHIKVWKFRTMVMNADALQKQLEAQNEVKGGVLFKMKNDPRITKVGRFLRRYSLDELPQLINVLIGDMSLVGPRPLPLRDVEGFSEHHYMRHNVLPGITGLWQVSGRSDITDFDYAFRLDVAYINNWSLALDFQILLKTIKVVLGKEGAY